MRVLFILLLFLASCSDPSDPVKDDSGLPSSTFMETEGTVKAPVQTIDFCEKYPEFEKC